MFLAYLFFVTLSFFYTECSSSFVQRGSVGGGNYSHFVINEHESFTLNLYSFKGDADIYISERIQYPSFDLDEHSFQSVTCGVDSVILDESVQRPIYVAVYGHPAYPVSDFVLELQLSSKAAEEKERSMYNEDGFTWILNNIIYYTKKIFFLFSDEWH
nr:UPF0669 protein C6orf120 homolog isoform X2 [Lepeophtheirus salmonis]